MQTIRHWNLLLLVAAAIFALDEVLVQEARKASRAPHVPFCFEVAELVKAIHFLLNRVVGQVDGGIQAVQREVLSDKQRSQDAH